MSLAYLRPDADSSDGSWLNELGAATLFSSIDESVASDADYIVSSNNPAHDICKISLSNPAGTPAEPCALHYRYTKTGNSCNVTVSLLQGVTTIASWSHSDPSTSFVDASQTLTTPQFASISDFTDLFVTFDAFLAEVLIQRDNQTITEVDGTIIVNERLS